MGRPRLYNTTEEKAAANRAKSKKHYEKEKISINKRRRHLYQHAHQATASEIVSTPVPTTALRLSQTEKSVMFLLERTARVQARLEQVLEQHPPTKYLDQLVLQYLHDSNKDLLHTQTIVLGRFQKSLYRYQNEMLSLVGLGPEYERVDCVVKQVGKIIGWVEEVFCHAIVSAGEVERLHSTRGFMYQTE